jgi:hypothetical protein
MSLRIYVASKFENTLSVREAHKALKDDGHVITHDWTGESAEDLRGEAREVYLQECAEKDVRGVLSADAFLLLNHVNMAGGFTELGMAIANEDCFIVVIDGKHKDKPSNIFFHLPFVHHATNLEHARALLKAHDLFLTQQKEAATNGPH